MKERVYANDFGLQVEGGECPFEAEAPLKTRLNMQNVSQSLLSAKVNLKL